MAGGRRKQGHQGHLPVAGGNMVAFYQAANQTRRAAAKMDRHAIGCTFPGAAASRF
jgi:predicted ATPase